MRIHTYSTYMCTHIYTYTYIYTYTHMHAHTQIHIYAYAYIHVRAHIYTHIYHIHLHMHAYTLLYTHIVQLHYTYRCNIVYLILQNFQVGQLSWSITKKILQYILTPKILNIHSTQFTSCDLRACLCRHLLFTAYGNKSMC